jgi:hypothetical protein
MLSIVTGVSAGMSIGSTSLLFCPARRKRLDISDKIRSLLFGEGIPDGHVGIGQAGSLSRFNAGRRRPAAPFPLQPFDESLLVDDPSNTLCFLCENYDLFILLL